MSANKQEKFDNKPFKDWCSEDGNQAKLARHCDVSPQAVNQWLKKVPAERVHQVVSCPGCPLQPYQVRPDLYPVEKGVAA